VGCSILQGDNVLVAFRISVDTDYLTEVARRGDRRLDTLVAIFRGGTASRPITISYSLP